MEQTKGERAECFVGPVIHSTTINEGLDGLSSFVEIGEMVHRGFLLVLRHSVNSVLATSGEYSTAPDPFQKAKRVWRWRTVTSLKPVLSFLAEGNQLISWIKLPANFPTGEDTVMDIYVGLAADQLQVLKGR